MKRLTVSIPGVSIDALLAETSVEPLGVVVEFHPGINPSMRQMALEAALRLWKREVGTVNQGRAPEGVLADSVWLRGWTIQPFQEQPVVGLRIAYGDAPEQEDHDHGQAAR